MKSILLKDKELAGWWQSFVNHANYEKVMALVRSELFSHAQSQERNMGAENVIEMMQHFAENEPGNPPLPSPGLQHNIKPKK